MDTSFHPSGDFRMKAIVALLCCVQDWKLSVISRLEDNSMEFLSIRLIASAESTHIKFFWLRS
jgi:hypothetical protein